MKVALTGGIACGKSRVASFLSAQDVDVCEADELAHRALAAGTDVYAAVVDRFGKGILAKSGEIDRSVLAERVFSSGKELAALNALVHPAVEAAWNTWLEERQGAMAVVVVPLLFEAGYGQGWDAVICVCASPATRKARLLERGLTASQADARMRAQWPQRDKAARADYVLWNDGTVECLEAQVVRMLDSMKRGQ
ncbi:MAG: dephospho-CoA kinase [Kiritimatiellia bacterium]|jgi:dephospho-CoA kinase|nr:dephospho-CoA kinase [Kiritimatiellia bacterium]MDP6629896.1 dephospho-CoA kinase [Kiritimatiellia bacterium]MDP6810564.1 dephospho-CoA kinase [Kiritimatiellia bacterium]MDP7022849.1 dephospho-CoA kinase [Kiritimatiellia bacterium]